jgi:hypothetical protein
VSLDQRFSVLSSFDLIRRVRILLDNLLSQMIDPLFGHDEVSPVCNSVVDFNEYQWHLITFFKTAFSINALLGHYHGGLALPPQASKRRRGQPAFFGEAFVRRESTLCASKKVSASSS